MVSQAIAAGDVQAINYFIAQDYVKAFEKLAISPQQKTLILPAEMSALVGAIGGIGALGERSDFRRTATRNANQTVSAGGIIAKPEMKAATWIGRGSSTGLC